MPFKNYNLKKFFVLFFVLLTLTISQIGIIHAENLDELNARINQKKDELQKLDKEIEEQRKILQQTSGQATTLQAKISSLEANRKKIESEIKKTQVEIDKANLMIQKLNSEITDKQAKINLSKQGISTSIKELDKIERTSLIEKFLAYEGLSEFWSDIESTSQIQNKLKGEIDVLLNVTTELKQKEDEKIAEKNSLSKFQTELTGKKESVQQTKAEQQTILAQTRNKEAEYQKILAQKMEQKKAFEQEVFEIESKIKMIIDPNSYPTGGNGILGWPLEKFVITQYFGKTKFAMSNPGIYNQSLGHQGVDFGVPIGTSVRSAEAGTIVGADNTDAYYNCHSWGKWILVRHDNGLSSLYAHLSSILVKPGQKVERGQVIGLSGNSGVSTGPHLHFTVYATQGVQVHKYKDYVKTGYGCAATEASAPFSDLSAYLDPMLYMAK